jgi:putative hydroxymethylpyrimidine transport system permease protein
MASKVVAATLIIFFPVASTLADGLLRTERGQLDLARVMGATPMRLLFHLRLPAAMPAFASGMRMAATVAPIGAVIGEWVGASAGLGFIMLQANARMQTDLLFAALFILAVVAIALYYAVDFAMRRLVWWQPVTAPEN